MRLFDIHPPNPPSSLNVDRSFAKSSCSAVSLKLALAMSNGYSLERATSEVNRGKRSKKIPHTEYDPLGENPTQEQTGPSAGVTHDFAPGNPKDSRTTRVILTLCLAKPNAFFGTRRRRIQV